MNNYNNNNTNSNSRNINMNNINNNDGTVASRMLHSLIEEYENTNVGSPRDWT